MSTQVKATYDAANAFRMNPNINPTEAWAPARRWLVGHHRMKLASGGRALVPAWHHRVLSPATRRFDHSRYGVVSARLRTCCAAGARALLDDATACLTPVTLDDGERDGVFTEITVTARVHSHPTDPHPRRVLRPALHARYRTPSPAAPGGG